VQSVLRKLITRPGPPQRTKLVLWGAVTDNGTVRIWDTGRPGVPVAIGAPLAVPLPGSATSIAFSRDGRTLVPGSTGGTVTEWDIADPARAAGLAVLDYARLTTWPRYTRPLGDLRLGGDVRQAFLLPERHAR
jgi:WD40 repeat protein